MAKRNTRSAPAGAISEPIDITIRVSLEEMRAGKKMCRYECPLAEKLKAYFGPGVTALVDWDRITIWPRSRSAVVTCKTPARLREWMEKFDTATEVRDFPRPLDAKFTAQLIYAKADRRRVEDWARGWHTDAPAPYAHPPSESWQAQIQAIVSGAKQQITLDSTHPQQ